MRTINLGLQICSCECLSLQAQGELLPSQQKGAEKRLLHINNNITHKREKRGVKCGRVAWEQERRCSQADVWSLEADSFQWVAVISSIFTLMALWELQACRQFHPVCFLLSSPAAPDTCGALTRHHICQGAGWSVVQKVTQHIHEKVLRAFLNLHYICCYGKCGFFFQNVSVSINFLVWYSSKWALKGFTASKKVKLLLFFFFFSSLCPSLKDKKQSAAVVFAFTANVPAFQVQLRLVPSLVSLFLKCKGVSSQGIPSRTGPFDIHGWPKSEITRLWRSWWTKGGSRQRHCHCFCCSTSEAFGMRQDMTVGGKLWWAFEKKKKKSNKKEKNSSNFCQKYFPN